jgi:ferredoxin
MITRKHLEKWFDQTMAEKTLIAPRMVDRVLLYRPVIKTEQIEWDYLRPVLSAKEAFFPATEKLLTIEKNGQSFRLQESLPEGYQVLFGVRPCDVRGIAAMDALFIDSDPIDQNYASRRENTLVVGMACDEMGETCFCTSTGGAPDDPTGMDVMLKTTDGGYEVIAVTEKGKKIVQDEWGTENYELVESYLPSFTQKPQFTVPEQDAWPPQFNDEYWADLAERCLSCRICAYVCPTCRCFDVRDEVIPSNNGTQQYERVRCWDSCAGEKYRKIAGGHNPRAQKGPRLRNRFLCKFYYYPHQVGPLGCTGCGRCIDSCPVNIDITEVMTHVMEVRHDE